MSVITSFPARMLISFIPLHIKTLFHNSQETAWNPQVTIQLKCIRYESRQWNISDMNSDDGHLKMARNGWTGNKTMGPLTWWWHREALWLAHHTLFWPLIGCSFSPHIPDVIVSHRPIVLYQGHSTWSQVTGISFFIISEMWEVSWKMLRSWWISQTEEFHSSWYLCLSKESLSKGFNISPIKSNGSQISRKFKI